MLSLINITNNFYKIKHNKLSFTTFYGFLETRVNICVAPFVMAYKLADVMIPYE